MMSNFWGKQPWPQRLFLAQQLMTILTSQSLSSC
jgi:hypothetical protein